jgi:hypothetical protein
MGKALYPASAMWRFLAFLVFLLRNRHVVSINGSAMAKR